MAYMYEMSANKSLSPSEAMALLRRRIAPKLAGRFDTQNFHLKHDRSAKAHVDKNKKQVLSVIEYCLLLYPHLTAEEQSLLVDLRTSVRKFDVRPHRAPVACRYCARTTTHVTLGESHCGAHGTTGENRHNARLDAGRLLVIRALNPGSTEIVRQSDHPRAAEVIDELVLAQGQAQAESRVGEKLSGEARSRRERDRAKIFCEGVAGRAWDNLIRRLQNARARELGWGLEAEHMAQRSRLDLDLEEKKLNHNQFAQKDDELGRQIAARERRDEDLRLEAADIDAAGATWWAHPAQAVARKQVIDDLYEILSPKPRIQPDRVKQALAAIEGGMSQKLAAERYRLSSRTIRRYQNLNR